MEAELSSNQCSQAPVLDSGQLKMLLGVAGEDGSELLRDLLEAFVIENISNLEGLKQAVTSCDLNMVARRAHAIAGSSANLGGVRLSKISSNMENEAPEIDPLLLGHMVEQIEKTFQLTVQSIKAEIEKITD